MSDTYDSIIIGAGIGGLVCGCYLAKAGLKVLIVEQHFKPGGCCTSFERQGYRFDVGVHYVGSLREEGILFKILKDFNLLNSIKFLKNDPTDRIITPGKTIYIRENKNKTKEELISNFPKEKENICNFFNFILNENFLDVVAKTKHISFKRLLDIFFHDYKIKAILSILLGNLGLPPSQISGLASIVFLKEYIFDGGYYPEGGIQNLPDSLSRRFKDYNGKLLLSTKVSQIITKKGKVAGVRLNNKEIITSKVVVSNADATSTFANLLNCKSKECAVSKLLVKSTSAFIIYLGLKQRLNIKPKHYVTWFFPTYDIESCYGAHIRPVPSLNFKYLLLGFPSLIDPSLSPNNKSILRVFVGAEFFNERSWKSNRNIISERMLEKTAGIIPEIQDLVDVMEIATPLTFAKYTSNDNGALFGWASIPSQIDRKVFPASTSVENLFLTGHWVTNGAGQGGISPSAYCGKTTSRLVLRKFNLIKP